jgi:acetyl esterase
MLPLKPDVLVQAGDPAPTLLTPAMAGLLDRIRRAGGCRFHALTPAEARHAPTSRPAPRCWSLPRAAGPGAGPAACPAPTARPLPARLYADPGRGRPAGAAVPARRRLRHRRPGDPRQPVPPAGAAQRRGRCWRWTTGWRPSTAFPPPWTTPGRTALAGRAGRRAWAWMARIAVGGDSAGGTLAAVAPCMPATPACRWRCSC